VLHITRQRSYSTWNKRSVVAGILLACLLYTHSTHADITADGTLGTMVNPAGSDFDITGGTGIGSNLFHSFNVFDIHTGETATFQGPASVTRILSRVTGGSTSNIDGTLRSAIGGADLYLINPAGVMFGPNAVLDVQGSFHVSTADYLALGSDGRFDASTPASSVLTAAAPSAFGFVSNTPASITFNGSYLQLPAGETLSVVGGDITLEDATLFATQGRIDIASVASAGEVVPSAAGLDVSGFSNLGDIRITHSTGIGGRPFFTGAPLANIDVSSDPGGGVIYIRGGSFVADNGTIFSDTWTGAGGGKVDVAIQGDLALQNESRIASDNIFGTGTSGDVSVSARNISLQSGGLISARTFDSGNTGSITITAGNDITVSGMSPESDPRLLGNQASGIVSSSNGQGSGGDLAVSAATITVSDEARISALTSSQGNAGSITLNADRITVSNRGEVNVSTFREGDGGSIQVNAGDVDVSSGGVLISSTFGSGQAGDITINATGTVTVSGVAAGTDPLERSAIEANSLGAGNGGSISVTATELVVADRGIIQVNLVDSPTSGQASPTANTRAGTIAITADTLTLTGGGQVVSGIESVGNGGEVVANIAGLTRISGGSVDVTQSSGLYSLALGAGDSGSVQLTTGRLQMDGLSTINTSTLGAGNAGQLLIQADSVDLGSGARISSSTNGAGDGGQVAVNTTGAITATGVGSDGFGSGFYSDVQTPAGGQASDASGNGGNIDLSSASMTLSDGATVSAKSNGAGNAGTITVNAGEMLTLANNASITTGSTLSGGGKIVANARDLLYLVDSKITSSVADGSGNGGDITIDPEFVILDRSQIIAQAFAGSGGNISITTDYFLASSDSIVDASSRLGIDGQVNISSPDTDLTGSLTDLPVSFLNAAALLKQRCAARAGGTSSSLVVAGPGGVPAAPDGLLYTSVGSHTTPVKQAALNKDAVAGTQLSAIAFAGLGACGK